MCHRTKAVSLFNERKPAGLSLISGDLLGAALEGKLPVPYLFCPTCVYKHIKSLGIDAL